jgi:hypothetical protein
VTLVVTAILTIDGGQGYEDRETGAIKYSRPLWARFECLLCHTPEGPVTGATRVREFAANVRTDHPARCSATTATPQGAQAA